VESLSAPDRSGRPSPGSTRPVEQVDGFRILDLVAGLPISTWRYQWEDPHVRHLGPMAQDWAATFGLGEGETTIAPVDANGVALVSIQALYRLVGDLERALTELRDRVEASLDSHEGHTAMDDVTTG